MFCNLIHDYENLPTHDITECVRGQFGKDCIHICGNCLNETPCNFVNGVCAEGCAPGWKGDYCNESKHYKLVFLSTSSS